MLEGIGVLEGIGALEGIGVLDGTGPAWLLGRTAGASILGLEVGRGEPEAPRGAPVGSFLLAGGPCRTGAGARHGADDTTAAAVNE